MKFPYKIRVSILATHIAILEFKVDGIRSMPTTLHAQAV